MHSFDTYLSFGYGEGLVLGWGKGGYQGWDSFIIRIEPGFGGCIMALQPELS